ncbi:MAG: trypsin-like peptidase domain-containing protein [bacterium]|nr:trypsin-like peptidase domain-containing protein [bacterium]
MSKKTTFLILFLSLSLMFAFAGTTYRQAPMEKSPVKFNVKEYNYNQQVLYNWLVSEAAHTPSSFIDIHVTKADLEAMEKYSCESCGTMNQKVRVGITKPISFNLQLNSKTLSSTSDRGRVWTVAAASKDATALRLHLKNVSLPEGAALYIYNLEGSAFGPYTGRGPNNNGEFWTNTVTGSVAYLQLHLDESFTEIAACNFEVADVAHMGPKFILPFVQKPNLAMIDAEINQVENICSFNASCVEDASCYNVSAVSSAKNAVAHMQFVSGAYVYICSGGLVADTDSSSTIPYFLTANHCISKGSEASSLECYWQFKTSSCNGSCYDPVGAVPRTTGSSIVKTSSTSDYCLLELSETPPSGSAYLGWNSSPVANTSNYSLYRISHPGGAPQAYSHHKVDTSTGTCGGWPRGGWIYSEDIDGATEGGSSGSPVVNSSGEIVGQLSGACGYNTGDPCDTASNSTVDGAFANYFDDVKQWLDPGTTPGGGDDMYVNNISLSRQTRRNKYRGIANVTIEDDGGSNVSGASVTGTFTSGRTVKTVTATTNSSGLAVLTSPYNKRFSSYTFCVTNVTQSSYTYNSSLNNETCDTY